MLFFRFCGCFSCSREVLRTRRNLKLALNSFENDLHSESYFRKINVKKISKNLYEMANSCVEFRKNSRFSSIFFKIHNFGTHIFLYVYTTHTQLPHMSYSGFQIHNTCYTHVKSCVYMCCVQGSTLMLTQKWSKTSDSQWKNTTTLWYIYMRLSVESTVTQHTLNTPTWAIRTKYAVFHSHQNLWT